MNAALRIIQKARDINASGYAAGRRLCFRLSEVCKGCPEEKAALTDLLWAIRTIACAVHSLSNECKDLQALLWHNGVSGWGYYELRRYRALILDALEEDFKGWTYAPS